MKRESWGSMLTLVAVTATLTIFMATELDARGRGGGGRAGGGRSGFSHSGPAAGGSVGAHRQGGFSRGGHRDTRRHARGERRDWYQDRWKRRAVRALTITAFAALSCQRTTVIVNGVAYTSCGGSWYSRAYSGGSVTYVIVTPPPGY